MKKRFTYVVIVLIVFIAASCSKSDTDTEYPNPQGYEEYTPIQLTKAQEEMTAEINAFGIKLFKEIMADEPDENIVISPLSISLALAMLSSGAESETARSICDVLGFSGYSTDEMGEYYSKMVAALKIADRNCAFEVANSIWISKLLEVKNSFIKTSEAHFASEVKKHIDFTSPSARENINAWVSDKTHGKIKDLLEHLDPLTKMVLVNALYFNGKWGFEWDGSKKGSFHSADGSKSNVDMMHITDTGLRYTRSETYEIVDMPYGNGAFSFTVVLPDKDIVSSDGMNELLTGLKLLDKIRIHGYPGKGTIRLPEFKIEYENQDIYNYLTKMGMRFEDFSGISDTDLDVSKIIHKANIEVNRSGTEAAAATAIMMITTGVNSQPISWDPFEFIADHPFIYAIREASTGAILFLGTKQR